MKEVIEDIPADELKESFSVISLLKENIATWQEDFDQEND